jgi:hypothetical protein
MNVATVFDSSLPDCMIRNDNGIISVVRRKLMTSVSSVFTNAPTTPSDVKRRYSNGRVDDFVLRNG